MIWCPFKFWKYKCWGEKWGTRLKETVNPDMGDSMFKGTFVAPHRETLTSGRKTSLRECSVLNHMLPGHIIPWDPSSTSAVPNTFGTGDHSHGFPQSEVVGRRVLAVMPEWWGAMGSSWWRTDHSPTAHLLLCSLVSNCVVHSPKCQGSLLYVAWEPTKYIWLVKYHTLSRYFLDGWMDGQKNEQRNKGLTVYTFSACLKSPTEH